MIDYSVYTVPVIKAELKKAWHLYSATKSALIIRLNQTVDNESFTRFNRLPAELRCMIFELALPGRRVVRLGYLIKTPTSACDLTAVRNIMLTNKEALSVVLGRYGEANPKVRNKYINYHDDILCLCDVFKLHQAGGPRFVLTNDSGLLGISLKFRSIRTIALMVNQFISYCIGRDDNLLVRHPAPQDFLAASLGSVAIDTDSIRTKLLPYHSLEEIVLIGDNLDSSSTTDKWGMELDGRRSREPNWINKWSKSAPYDDLQKLVLMFQKAVAEAGELAALRKVTILYAGL